MTNTAMLIMDFSPDVRLVSVKFDNNNGQQSKDSYTYKTVFNDLEKGDRIIVDSPYTGLTTVTVINPNVQTTQIYEYKWIVDKINTDRYEAIKAAERTLVMLIGEMERSKRVEERIGSLDADNPALIAIKAALETINN